ncbi:glycoside hydrolase family 35 protein [Psychromicrobium xiongbiense]|uniref:glycoside hydrolase family 35 protein n=1 Tax=Psychromicrobium xiongbiense TaxID=3051184 RepID=UPI002556C2FD|nr:beta-galactosidase family protein [Psychromicrobium sp. YIM S02556]
MPESTPALSYADGRLLRHGTEHRLLGGAIHYFRVHPSQWADRLDRLVALGANTLDTYVAWNFHQLRKAQEPDFRGWRDVVRFIEMAGERGLDVMVRPGPYICAEWDNGGFPAWLTSMPGVELRSTNEHYQAAVERWLDVLLPRLTSLQASQGGPIVAFQAENEYGSYGDDPEYVVWSREVLLERGVTELVFSADGANDFYLDGGSIESMLATGTLGSGGTEALATWRRRRPGEPFIAAEFWNGWFDHWGEEHHTRNPEEAASSVAEIIDGGGSVCLYMAHGGTNFGLSAGANHDRVLQPTVTSYDSDAPIAEDGTLTPKFHAIREVFGRVRELPEIPEALLAPQAVLPAQSLPVVPGVSLLEFLRSLPVAANHRTPLSFEELDCPRGAVLYRARPILPAGEFTLRIAGLHDRATIFVNGTRVGVFEAEVHEPLTLTGTGERATVEILVENLGRINYGHLLGQAKGILGGLLINQRMTFDWDHAVLPLEEFTAAQLAQYAAPSGRIDGAPGFFSTELQVETPADTHLTLPGFGKSYVWLNGVLLGCSWERGPQHSLYVPSGLLTAGTTTVTILELEHAGESVELLAAADLG